MKHLFFVHSHITDIVARQIIKHEKYSEDQCLFLLDRNHKSEFLNQIKFPYTHFPIDSFGVSIWFWKNRIKVTKLDQWLSEITNGDFFTYYAPQSGMNYFHLIISHPKCQKYCYLEEGLCSYLKEDQLRNNKKAFFLRDILYGLNFKNRAPSVKHFFDLKNNKYKAAYGISEYSFPELPNRQILSLPFKHKKENQKYKEVIVLGQYVEYREMTIETLLEVMQYLLGWLVKRDVKEVHVKFHPAQKREISIESLERLFQSYSTHLKVNLIAKEVVLENIAIATDANFYIISSSVGIYAAISGNKVFCLAKKVVALEPSFQKKIDSFPGFLNSQLIFIK